MVSLSSVPARKAPKVPLKPRPSVILDSEMTVKSITAKNASCDLLLATSRKNRLNTFLPMKAISPRAIAAFVAAEVSAAARPPPPPASSGMATRSGTTARSCQTHVFIQYTRKLSHDLDKTTRKFAKY